MASLGIKKLTVENWLESDPVMSAFVKVSLVDGSKSNIDADEWASRFLKPHLNSNVPENVIELLEVARGSIIYDYFFYPLYTLAAEQLLRITEAAVSAKCVQLGAPSSVKTFGKKLEHLCGRGVIPPQEYNWRDAMRQMRNSASHLEGQPIMMPAQVLTLLTKVVKRVNALFI